MKHTIDLATEVSVDRAGCVLKVDLDKMPSGMLSMLVVHGLTQKIGDAAAGASKTAFGDDEGWDKMNRDQRKAWVESNESAIAKVALGNMKAVLENLLNGVWGATRVGSGIDPEVLIMLKDMIRDAVGETVFKKLKAGEQAEHAKALWETMDEAKREEMAETAEERKAIKAQAKAALAALKVPGVKI